MSSRIAISLCILACALLGGYASMFTSYHHGFFDALRTCTAKTSSSPARPCVLDMSDSVSKSITGHDLVDSLIDVLLEFFSQGLRTDPDAEGTDVEALLVFVHLATQFGGAWYIIALEGLRKRNRGTVLSWTGTIGMIFQAVTITIIAPIYLALQLLTSSSSPSPISLLADPYDLIQLPVSMVIAYLLPTIGLCLPLVDVLSGDAKFLVIALWQPFPLYHSAILILAQRLSRHNLIEKTAHVKLRDYRKALSQSNKFMASLATGVHLGIMGAVVVSGFTQRIPKISAEHIFWPTSLTSPPTLAIFDPPLSATDSRKIVVSFLRWDVYCTCASMLIWSIYELGRLPGAPHPSTLSLKIVMWTLIGGPILPSLMLLWWRDEMVLDAAEVIALHQKEE